MLSKTDIAFIRSLHHRRERESSGLFLAEGEKIIAELLLSGWDIELLCSTEEVSENKAKRAEKISQKEMERISTLHSPGKFLAVVKQKRYEWKEQKGIHLILDAVSDPGNLGTLVRISDWFGVVQLICTPETVDFYNTKTIMASMGSFLRVPFVIEERSEIIEKCRETDLPLFAADMKGDDLFSTQLPQNMALILGSESHGLHPGFEKSGAKLLTIPSFGSAESLNVGVAGGIFLARYQMCR